MSETLQFYDEPTYDDAHRQVISVAMKAFYKKPDITGRANWTVGGHSEPSGGGAFNVSLTGTLRTSTMSGSGDVSLVFKASDASSLYRGSTFQTNALRLLAIVKY